MTSLERANVGQVGEKLVSAGAVSAEELERYIELVDAGQIELMMPPLVLCWGRRPHGPGTVDGERTID